MSNGLCSLEAGLGRVVACPGAPCPFWDDRVCVIAGLRADLGSSEELAAVLLRVRDALGGVRAGTFGPLPPGLKP
jgi:hypothetical protein